MKRLVVVGNGMAGMACVEQILKYAPTFHITVFGDETHTNYNRVMLSSVLAGEKSADEIVINSREWYRRNEIDLRVGLRIVDVDSDLQTRGLQTRLTIDRATAARMGISVREIDNTLYDAFGQRQVSTIYKDQNQYHVVMEVEPEFAQNPESLKYVFIRGANNIQVPLAALHRPSTGNTSLAATPDRATRSAFSVRPTI